MLMSFVELRAFFCNESPPRPHLPCFVLHCREASACTWKMCSDALYLLRGIQPTISLEPGQGKTHPCRAGTLDHQTCSCQTSLNVM